MRNHAVAWIAAAFLTLSSAVAGSNAEEPPVDSTVAEEPGVDSTAAADRRIAATFRFESAFWFNFHHLLLQQAAIPATVQGTREFRRPPRLAAVDTGAWDESERAGWTAALALYSERMVRRSTLFDAGMVEIAGRLGSIDASSDPQAGGALAGDIVAALRRAAPAYRRHLWQTHDRQNRGWIEGLQPRLRQVIRDLPQRTLHAYGADAWPDEPIRVDVVVDAGWAGAYTTDEPPHITISSNDRRQQGWMIVETLFHEAGHVLVGRVWRGIEAECKRLGREVPRDLWHAVLFFSAGELMRPFAGDDYVPYAEKNGLYARSEEWSSYVPHLQAWWKPYLQGELEFEEALVGLVGAATRREL